VKMAKLFRGVLLLICLVFLVVTFILTRTFRADEDNRVLHIPAGFSEKKIHQYVINNDVSGIQKIIDSKMNLNQKDDQKMTPFLYAALTGNIPVMRLLENAGADVNMRRYGQNALHLAILNNQKEAVAYLISRGFDCRSRDYPEILYQMGAVKEIAHDNETKLKDNVFHLLAATGNIEIAMLFNDYEDMIDEKNIAGKTPLAIAAAKGHMAYMNYLLTTGRVDINTADNHGMTPLHCAVAAGQMNAIFLLIEKGADTATVNRVGETLLDTANRTKNREIIELVTVVLYKNIFGD